MHVSVPYHTLAADFCCASRSHWQQLATFSSPYLCPGIPLHYRALSLARLLLALCCTVRQGHQRPSVATHCSSLCPGMSRGSSHINHQNWPSTWKLDRCTERQKLSDRPFPSRILCRELRTFLRFQISLRLASKTSTLVLTAVAFPLRPHHQLVVPTASLQPAQPVLCTVATQTATSWPRGLCRPP